MEAASAYDAVSLESYRFGDDGDGETYAESIGVEDDRFELVEYGATIAPTLQALPARDRIVLHLRFVEDLTQAEIAERVGVSQMHVSRLIRRALDRLRTVAEHFGLSGPSRATHLLEPPVFHPPRRGEPRGQPPKGETIMGIIKKKTRGLRKEGGHHRRRVAPAERQEKADAKAEEVADLERAHTGQVRRGAIRGRRGGGEVARRAARAWRRRRGTGSRARPARRSPRGRRSPARRGLPRARGRPRSPRASTPGPVRRPR